MFNVMLRGIHCRIARSRQSGTMFERAVSNEQYHSGRRWWRNVSGYTGIAVLLTVGGLAQSPVPAQVPGTSKPPQAQPDPFSTTIADAGVKTCAATYAGLGKALAAGTQYTVQTQTSKVDADHHSVRGVVGMSYGPSNKGYSGPAAGLVFAAPVGQRCEGAIVRVVPFPQPCQTVVASQMPGVKPEQSLAGTQIYPSSDRGQIVLIPANQNCVAITIFGVSG